MSTLALDIEALDALWNSRHETHAIQELESLLRRALILEPTNYIRDYDLLWRAARAFHFRAMQCDECDNKQQAREYFSTGASFAREATEKDKGLVEGCFWRGVNEIEAARHTSTLAALAAMNKAVSFLERAEKLNEAYHFAGPLRVLGRIVHRKPLILGGSAGNAIDYFRRALEISPGNSTTQIYLVEALLTEQHKPEARRILNEIIAAPDNENWRWEQARDRRLAQEMLKTF